MFESFLIKQKIIADTKLTIVIWCQVLIRSTQGHLAPVSAGGINSQATCLPVSAIPAQLGPHSTWRSLFNQSSKRLTMFIRKQVFSPPFKPRVEEEQEEDEEEKKNNDDNE